MGARSPPAIENDPFTEDACRILNSAAGYLGLGMIEEANKELQKFSPDQKMSREVLRLRALIYCEVQLWEHMFGVSQILVSDWPEESDHWIWLAHATWHFRSLAEAEQVLLDALFLHESEAMIHFNLACYASKMGNLVTGCERLTRAIELDPAIRAMALNDPDLHRCWNSCTESPGSFHDPI